MTVSLTDLALNNLQWLICYETKTNQTNCSNQTVVNTK